ncbi:MAG: hypothetical protein AB8B85_18760 [Paracoccaceae bacterium]
MKTILIGVTLSLGLATSAFAGSVIVNGKALDRQERSMLAKYACGPIPDGNYWLNMNTGEWGYAGSSRVQGHIKDRCGNQTRRQSLSERGLLWRPGELVID